MKSRVQAILVLILLACLLQPARAKAAEADPKRPSQDRAADVNRGNPFVSVITQPTGEPILAIKYPWKRHARPSVEIRILEPSEAGNPLIRPLFFVHDRMKGGVTAAVYRCQDDSEDLRQRAVFSKDNMDFEIFGARNSLGRPSVCVTCRTTTADAPPETRAVFGLLDAWAVDPRTLYLELPAEYFSQPAKIRVWFLRGKDIVWTATVTWPGSPE